MTNTKEKYAFWLTPEAKKMIEINAPLANCGSQSEFVEKAVRFYDWACSQTVWPSCCST